MNKMAKKKIRPEQNPEANEAEKRVSETLALLTAVGMPLEAKTPAMQRRLARIFLAVCNIKPDTQWAHAAVYTGSGSWSLRSRGVIEFINEFYFEDISPGSYDDIRRENLDYLVQAELVLPSAARPEAQTNDGTRSYAANPEATDLLRTFGTSDWPKQVTEFKAKFGDLSEKLERRRNIKKLPVILPGGIELTLSEGGHNELQKAIIEEFIPRFAQGAEVLYVGDASNKDLYKVKERLERIKFFEMQHDRLPDVIAYAAEKNWLFLIEAVNTVNPMTKLRHRIIETACAQCTAGIVYVSVFKNRKAFFELAKKISWETEVWLAEEPDHMIHFNGDNFLGPHPRRA